MSTVSAMARRLPGVRSRLEVAAIELFAVQGFAATTGAQIAARAGTTERTFFRHFRDKADAAFGDEARLQEAMATAIAQHPLNAACEPVRSGFERVAELIEQQPAEFRRRAAVMAGNAELRDRELARAAKWSDLIVFGLTERGVDESSARLCAALHLALFRVASERWVATDGLPFPAVLNEVIDSAGAHLGTPAH